MATIQVKINTVDKSSLIDWASLKITQMLTSQPDSATFMIRNVPSKTYRPVLNDDVKIYKDGVLIFGGIVISTGEKIDGLLRYFTVTCKDYTELLDGTLCAAAYTSKTVSYIINDLVANFAAGLGITQTNVSGSFTVNAANFNYLSLSQCLTQLANAIPGYDWYIDYNKDIHFFQVSANSAPFGLDDTSGNFNYGTLEFDADQSQIRNSIVVRGGTVAQNAITNNQLSDGKQLIYYVGYNLSGFTASHALAASPTSFLTLTVGQDGVDNPLSFNCLYNPNLGLLRFPTAYPINDVVQTAGTPNYPLLSIVSDPVSIATYGTKQYLVFDKTITTKQQAIDRAQAELMKNSQPNYTGTFVTFKDGLVAGQYISIICPLRGISGSFKIQQVDIVMRTPSAVTSDLAYTVQFCSTLDIGIIELLNKFLIADVAAQLQVGANEVPDRIYGVNEIITVSDSVVSSISHNPQNETITIGETFVAQALNYAVQFVAGPFVPSGFKRPFILNGSRLG